MIKLFLTLGLLSHLSIYSQSIEKLLSHSYPIEQYVKADGANLLIDLANNNLNSLSGFGEIVRYINTIHFANNRTITINLASNRLHTLDNNDFIQFVMESPVENLNISDNELKKLPHGFLSDTTKKFNTSLKVVFLRKNNLKRLPHCFLVGAPGLTILDLSQNHFRSSSAIPKHFFKNKPQFHALLIAGRYSTPPKAKGHKPKKISADLEAALEDSL